MLIGLVAEEGEEGKEESHSKVGTLWVRQTSFQHSTKCKTEECLAVQICYINFTAKFFMLHLSAIWSSQVNYSATCNIREKNELQDFD